MSDNEHGESTMPDHALAYPADNLRGTAPTARAWAVARGIAPGSHYALTESWADQRGRYATGEIVARGLTEPEALAQAYSLNQCGGGGPGAEVVRCDP
jgi:hypothetical protein